MHLLEVQPRGPDLVRDLLVRRQGTEGERLPAHGQLGVTLGQLPALLALYEQDGLTQSELARRTGVEQPTMAVNLRRMERDGLIARTPDPGDARRALVGLTPKAKSIREPVRQLRAGIDEDSLTGFTPAEHVQLRDFLARITGNLDTMLNARPKADPTGG
ncbi:MarR family winged helix-turn-helix transcriptional regulator [Streptomyces sp. NPDC090045]|uniref:MarR family winged helix-turn-helix transcriptional regulator n=1 Tax=Streptomyces sp. NPDC090045 TaxID=3365927 RepID=UPI0037FE44E7